MSRFINPALTGLLAYVPGEQPQDRRYVKLNTNESPFPPSEGVKKALREEAGALNLYPDPEGKVLRGRLASLLGISESELVLGNGSDELLSFALLAFGSKGAAFPDISYGFYKVCAELYGEKYETPALDADFKINPSDYFGRSGLVFIANPNAPTGLCLSPAEIESVLKGAPDCVVVIDEAYIAFGGESCLPLIKKYDNLLVLRTFSKSRSMAGARLGFAAGSPGLIKDLDKVRNSINPYNINRLTLAAGTAAVEDDEYYVKNCREIARVREYTSARLREMGFFCTDSKANFIFARHAGVPGRLIFERLRERGVLVRRFDLPRISEFLRVTVGDSGQMDVFLGAAGEIIDSERKKKA